MAKGGLWAAPVIATAAAAPAIAVSPPKATATAAAPKYFHTIVQKRVTELSQVCSTTNPPPGFIDTLPCNDVTSPASTSPNTCSGSNNPNSSNGFWFQSANAGTVNLASIQVTYTFDQNVTLNSCPSPANVAKTSYPLSGSTTTWTACNVLNGWTATQTSPKVITMTYASTAGVASQKTSATSGGWNTGFFINLTFSTCNAATVTTSAVFTYSDATGTHTTTVPKGPTTLK